MILITASHFLFLSVTLWLNPHRQDFSYGIEPRFHGVGLKLDPRSASIDEVRLWAVDSALQQQDAFGADHRGRDCEFENLNLCRTR